MIEWGIAKCQNRGIEVNLTNINKILYYILPNINVPNITMRAWWCTPIYEPILDNSSNKCIPSCFLLNQPKHSLRNSLGDFDTFLASLHRAWQCPIKDPIFWTKEGAASNYNLVLRHLDWAMLSAKRSFLLSKLSELLPHLMKSNAFRMSYLDDDGKMVWFQPHVVEFIVGWCARSESDEDLIFVNVS